MADNATSNLELPLLLPAQAQKHVTVNDALVRLDGAVDLVLQSISRTTPPTPVVERVVLGYPQRGCQRLGRSGRQGRDRGEWRMGLCPATLWSEGDDRGSWRHRDPRRDELGRGGT